MNFTHGMTKIANFFCGLYKDVLVVQSLDCHLTHRMKIKPFGPLIIWDVQWHPHD